MTGRSARSAGLFCLAAMAVLLGCAERPVGSGTGSDAPTTWTVDAAPLRVIGDGDGMEFGGVTGLGLMTDGSIVLVDGAGPAVWLIPASGGKPIQVGRVGNGPGEYRFPQFLNVLANDEFAIYDVNQRRVTRYAPTGAFQADQGLPMPAMGGTMDVPVGLLPDRKLLVKRTPMPRPASPGEAKRMTADVAVVDSSGAVQTSYGTFGLGDFAAASFGGMSMLVPKFLGWTLVVALSDRYVAIGESDKYEVTIYDLSGGTVGTVREERQPRPVTENRRAPIVAAMEAQNAPPGMTDPERFAEFLPEFRNTLVDHGGHIWVLPVPDSIRFADTVLVYTHDGTPVASLGLPYRFDLRAVADTLVAGVVSDSNDTQSVHVLRLRRGERALQ